jgi:hypothetical protein
MMLLHYWTPSLNLLQRYAYEKCFDQMYLSSLKEYIH